MGSRKGKGRRPDHPLKQELGRDAGLEGQLAEGLPVHRAADAPEFPSAEVPDRTIVASSRTMVRLVHLMRPYRTIVCRAGFHCAIGALYRPQPHKKHLFTGGRAVGDRDDPKGAPRPEFRAPGHPSAAACRAKRGYPPPTAATCRRASELADPAPKALTPPEGLRREDGEPGATFREWIVDRGGRTAQPLRIPAASPCFAARRAGRNPPTSPMTAAKIIP